MKKKLKVFLKRDMNGGVGLYVKSKYGSTNWIAVLMPNGTLELCADISEKIGLKLDKRNRIIIERM